jgi:N-acetylneuraminate synthase
MESKHKRGDRVFVIAEAGINANGDIDIAKKLIDSAVECDCDAIKFQKRDVDTYVPEEKKSKLRETPWGNIPYIEYKKKLEFETEGYDEIDRYCKEKGIAWFASPWDIYSVDFLKKYDLQYNKIASAMLTDKEVLEAVAAEKKYTFISTGMSDLNQIQKAVDIFRKNDCPFELMHCNSTYPMMVDDANLLVMPELKEIFNCDVGYSGHESGIVVSCAAVAMGASSIERHITLSRSMYGSDQSASLEIAGLKKLVQYIRAIERSFGSSTKVVSESEEKVASQLRRKNTT